MVHVPTPINVITPPLIVATPAEVGSMLNVTESPAEDTADGVYVAPPTTALEGAAEVNEIVCEPLPTVKVWVT
jgi:hypothetical protein